MVLMGTCVFVVCVCDVRIHIPADIMRVYIFIHVHGNVSYRPTASASCAWRVFQKTERRGSPNLCSNVCWVCMCDTCS